MNEIPGGRVVVGAQRSFPADLGPNSFERYMSATHGGAVRAGDSYDVGLSMRDDEEEVETPLGSGAGAARLKEAFEAAKTGASHGYPDWPIFGSGDAKRTEPEGLPNFREGEPTASQNPLVAKDVTALLVEYNRPGR